MIRLLVLLSLLPSFTLAKDYAISNPETIFITQESLLSNLKKTENHNKTCENEKIVKLLKRINSILVEYSKENNISTTIDKKYVIMTKSENDITEKILVILDK